MSHRFEKQCRLGEGTYSVVYKCLDRVTNKIVAVKKIRLMEDTGGGGGSHHNADGMPCTTLREVMILRTIPPHPHLVNLIEVIEVTSDALQLYLVFEYLPYDLRKVMGPSLPALPVKKLMFQMLSGLMHLHMNGALHRDIKPPNILLSEDLSVAKLADFNLARYVGAVGQGQDWTDTVVTLWYRAPELLLGLTAYDGGIDVWALGCVLYEMAGHPGGPLFPGTCEIDQLFKIFKVVGTMSAGQGLPHYQPDVFPQWAKVPMSCVAPMLDPTGRDLLEKMLCPDPKRRITAAGAMSHAWFWMTDGW